MNRITVGFDGTKHAKDALHLAAYLASATSARLTVACVFEAPPPDLTHVSYGEAKSAYYSRTFALAEAELGTSDFDRRELDGAVGEGLCELAESEAADLIVIGSTHLSAVDRVFVGAAGTALFNGAPCGVLVATRGWAQRRSRRPGLIGVGYDGTSESKLALQWATRLAQALRADLKIITVAPLTLGEPGDAALSERWSDLLQDGVESVPAEINTQRVLLRGRAATELSSESGDLDLLVLGSRKRGPVRRTVLGSVSGELVRMAQAPVLVVPRSAVAATAMPTATATG